MFAHAPARREDCIVIGDSLSSDIAGARGAGVPSILYAPRGVPDGAEAADYVTHSYRQIIEILDQLR